MPGERRQGGASTPGASARAGGERAEAMARRSRIEPAATRVKKRETRPAQAVNQ
jgi:hypothetical protein